MTTETAKQAKQRELAEAYKVWEKKLADSGFVDIEYRVDGVPADYLRGPNPMDFVRAGKNRIESNYEYYASCRAMRWSLRDEGADTETIRVWDLHAEGKSVRAIVNTLGVQRRAVGRIIKRVRSDMQRRLASKLPPFEDEPTPSSPTPTK